ncbi:unnamed protein product [Urochloa decumbens]|uniref:Uncharacterized protein n=1 Tax=Urochloa decumbens TaxID=240449 RepID=A0ABC9H0G0_9POAL
MGPDEIFLLIRKSIVRVTIDKEEICGIIIACKAGLAYVIADATDYSQGCKINVKFPDDNWAAPLETDCYEHNGILGMCCHIISSGGFDRNVVSEVDICEDDADECEKVYVYEGLLGTINEGHAMKIDQEHYKVTNLAGDYSQYGAPVVKEDGRLVGFCCSFKHSLTAKTIVSVADSFERSHNRNFTCLAETLSYLRTII